MCVCVYVYAVTCVHVYVCVCTYTHCMQVWSTPHRCIHAPFLSFLAILKVRSMFWATPHRWHLFKLLSPQDTILRDQSLKNQPQVHTALHHTCLSPLPETLLSLCYPARPKCANAAKSAHSGETSHRRPCSWVPPVCTRNFDISPVWYVCMYDYIHTHTHTPKIQLGSPWLRA